MARIILTESEVTYTVVLNSHPSKIDDLTGQGGAPPAEMSRNIPAACSLAHECDQVPWRNRE